ncbi:hypothetical protein, partial [Salmonella enterica]|uniref:hypothetical protein n=1 Tax=Salmonella enterica TaxID=28901 RepID=UPI000AA740DF
PNKKRRRGVERAEAGRPRAREALRGQAAHLSQSSRVLASKKSSYDPKKELLNVLRRKLQDVGVRAAGGG